MTRVEDEEFTVGHIPYLNCVPFFHYLQQVGWTGRLKSGVPSELNRMLQQSELHVSPSSSFEYARHWQDYLIVPNHSISSDGPVQSVLFFSPEPLERLTGNKIFMTGESATSINLFRIIMLEFIGVDKISDEVVSTNIEALLASGKPTLLIGDRALRAAQNVPQGMFCFDLGELWKKHTGLPFVFALWMARKEAVTQYKNEIEALSKQLFSARSLFFDQIEELASHICKDSSLTVQGKVGYWKGIDYNLDQEHIKGMELFFDLCLKHGLLANCPEIRFLQ